MGDFYKMNFSYFQNGIKDNTPLKTISIDQLVETIKNNPKKDIISTIHSLRSIGDSHYQVLKEKLPNITPNSLVRAKKLSGKFFEENFVSFSNYIYFDIDTDNENYKDYFINSYGNQITLVCKSSSGGGISILVKVSTQLTKQNFKTVWSHIRNTVFKTEPIDEQCCNIARSWLIPYDEAPFYNPTNILTIDINSIITKRTPDAKQCIMFSSSFNTYTPCCTSKIIDIKKIFEVLKFESTTQVNNQVLDFNPVYTCKVYMPKNIPNTKKRKTYSNIIHNLVYLNPTVDPEYIYSYLYFINRYHAQPSMEPHKLLEFFRFIYNHIIKTETVKPSLKLKRIHFNHSCALTKEKKNDIANKLNGLYKRKLKIDLIMDAKEELKSLGLDITTKSVCNLTGIKLRSVQLYFKYQRIDFDLEIQHINDTYKSIN
jgi:hypothetical protein